MEQWWVWQSGLTAGIDDLRGASQPKCVRDLAWKMVTRLISTFHFCAVVCSQGSASITAGVKSQTCLAWCWKMKDTEDFPYLLSTTTQMVPTAPHSCPGPSSTGAFSTHSTLEREEKGGDTHKIHPLLSLKHSSFTLALPSVPTSPNRSGKLDHIFKFQSESRKKLKLTLPWQVVLWKERGLASRR